MITTQAVYNVFEGDRYATISQEIRDYCLGYFGTPPEPIDPDVGELVNGREEPITCRPADLLEPGLPAARDDLAREGVRADPEALVTHALFGDDFVAFVRGEALVERLADEGGGVSPGGPALDPSRARPPIEAEVGLAGGRRASRGGAGAPGGGRRPDLRRPGLRGRTRRGAPHIPAGARARRRGPGRPPSPLRCRG